MAEGKGTRDDEGRGSGGGWRDWSIWDVFRGKDDESSRRERAADDASTPTDTSSEVPESSDGDAVDLDAWAAMSAEERLEVSDLAHVGGAANFKELTGKDWSELTKQERAEALSEAADLQAVGGREGFKDLTGKEWDALTSEQRNEAISEEGEVELLGGREGFRDLTGQDWDALSPAARTEAARVALAEMESAMRQMDLDEGAADQSSADASAAVPAEVAGPVAVAPADGAVEDSAVDESATGGVASSSADEESSEQSADSLGGGIPASADDEPSDHPMIGAAVAVITDVDGNTRTVYMDEDGNFYLDDGTPHSGYLSDGSHLSEAMDTSGTFHEFEGDVIEGDGGGPGAGTESSGGSGSSSGSSTGSSGDSSDGSTSDDDGDDDDDDDDDDGQSDTTDETADADSGSEESEEDEGAGGDEGTPHPDHHEVDPAELAAFMDSPLGRQSRQTEERGIEVNVSGGVTDPVEPSGDRGVPVASNLRPGRGDVDPPGEYEESSGFGPIDEMRLPGAGVVDPIVLDVSGGPGDPSVGPPDDDDGGGDGGDDEGAIAARTGDLEFGVGAVGDLAAAGSTPMFPGDTAVADVDAAEVDDATTSHLGGLSAEQLSDLEVDHGFDLSAAEDVSSRLVDLSDLANRAAESIDTDQIADQITDG